MLGHGDALAVLRALEATQKQSLPWDHLNVCIKSGERIF